jgi:Protein of unknown function (DUF1524)
MRIIETFLNSYGTAQARQQTTSSLLIPFRLSESGEKLSKRLSDQRRYLRAEYEELPDIGEKREFVRHLAHAASFRQSAWPDDPRSIPDIQDADFEDRDLVRTCLDTLVKGKHEITIGLLVRFFSMFRSASAVDRARAARELEHAISSVTAFDALWRGSRRTTQNIDNVYRSLLREGIPGTDIGPLSRKPKHGRPVGPSTDALNRALRSKLAEGATAIRSRQEWVDLAASVPVYNVSISLTRFLLLASSHDSTDDGIEPGLIKAGRLGSLRTLCWDHWRNDGLEIEHVAPQNGTQEWDPDIYSQTDLVDTLGNLTLVPKLENISLGNRAWTVKRLIYEILAAPSADDLQASLERGRQEGIQLSASTEDILTNARFLAHVSAISKLSGNWDKEFIQRRSKRLASLIWDRLSPWLGYQNAD